MKLVKKSLARRVRVLSSALSFCALVAPIACSGTDNSDSADDMTMGGAGNRPAQSNRDEKEDEIDCTVRDAEIFQLDHVFWSAGFKISLGEAKYFAATEDCASTALLIEGKFQNRSDEAAFRTRVLLNAGGVDYVGQIEAPEVEYQLTGEGYIYFESLSGFPLEDAVMFVGNAGEHQAVLPIGEDSAESMITLETVKLGLDQEFESSDLRFKLTSSTARADYPPSHRNLDKDIVQLRFWMDITSKGGVENYATDHFSIKLPDGSVRYPAKTAGSGMLYAHETVTGYNLMFEVPYPAEGTYVLNGHSHSADDVPGELEFEVPVLPFGG